MDDDFDIYGDLPATCDIKNNEASLGNNEECEGLKKEVSELSSKLQKLQKINETLEVNLSSLLKTAKAEIARKDKMIDQLRKQVDDMSFKRGYFSRNKRDINGRLVKQMPIPNTQELNNVHPECTTNLTTNADHFGHDEDVSDYESFSNKRHKVKYTNNLTESSKLTTTVFTERLRKKIIEEDEAERKRKSEEQEKQNLLLENNHENNKEINIDDKENQSHFSIWNSNVDNTTLKCKGTDHDYTDNINNPEDTTAYLENQQRLVVSTKVSARRPDNDIDMSYSNKRRKLETEQNTCINKDSLSKKEDVYSRYDDEIMSNTSINKFDYEEDTNTCIERNDPHCNAQYERGHSRLRSNDGYYKRKEHYKKSNNDYNYSKESTYYHEKDKYNNTQNRSPVPRYSDKRHKYHDDRYRDHRDKFDRRRNFHDKEEETPIIPNKRFYDLRHKDKIKFNRKYNSKDFYSPRHKESRYSDLRASRSASHERSKSGSRERTNHKSYDRKSSKSIKTNNGLEKHITVPLTNKNETNESKASSTLRKKDDISKKSVKTNNIESLESTEIIYKSHSKSSTNAEHKKVENAKGGSINVDNDKSENELVSSKPVDVQTTNSCIKATKEENGINTEYEENENDNQVKGVEDVIVQITTNVNISPDGMNIPLDENKQDCMITSVNTIVEEKSNCDKHIVQHQTADEKAVNTCDDIPNFPGDVSNSVMVISAEAKQENNITDKNEVETEEACNKPNIVRNNTFQSNTSKNMHSSPKNSLENTTSTLNDLEEQLTVKPPQKNEQDNNGNDHVTSKDSESKKKSSEREKSKIIIVARRRKRVQLADNNASMTLVITSNNTNLDTDLKNNIDNNLKSRACKVSRSYKNVL